MGLEHRGTIILPTERLKLRKFEYDDLKDLNEITRDPYVTRWLVWDAHETLERTEKVIKRTLNNYSDPDYYHWAVENLENQKVIGSVSLNYVDDWNHSAEIGYLINRKYWGNGYATEASKKVIDFAFKEIKFNRLVARAVCNNSASLRIFEKCHMVFEGIERQRYYIEPSGFEDSFSYSILRQDYLQYN